MKLIYQGKTKDIYKVEDLLCLKFKDDVTGTDGQFDPGANQVGLSIVGMGKLNLEMTTYFLELLNSKGVGTHYVSADIEAGTLLVKPLEVFGQGLEVITRYRATGSFIKRYGAYVEEGQELDAYVELTLKDDVRQDPLVTSEGIVALGIMTQSQYQSLLALNIKVAEVIRADLAAKGLELYDLKLEFGYQEGHPNEIILMDEISGGNMRVYQGDQLLTPSELAAFYNRQ